MLNMTTCGAAIDLLTDVLGQTLLKHAKAAKILHGGCR